MRISYCCCSVAKWCLTLCDPMKATYQASLSFTISQGLLKLISTESVTPSNQLILSHPFSSSKFSNIRVFFNESTLGLRWKKYWSFSISPSNEYSGLIFFRIDCFDLVAVQGTFKSLLQHHSSKASVLWCSTFFMVQLSHLYLNTGKNSLTIRIFVSRVMYLLICYLGLS